MQIWHYVDPKLLAELLVQAARTYAQAKDRQNPASVEVSEIAERPSG